MYYNGITRKILFAAQINIAAFVLKQDANLKMKINLNVN